jgi:hypothetical protein
MLCRPPKLDRSNPPIIEPPHEADLADCCDALFQNDRSQTRDRKRYGALIQGTGMGYGRELQRRSDNECDRCATSEDNCRKIRPAQTVDYEAAP